MSHSWREYSTDMAALPDVAAFITEDEINDSIAHGSSVEGGKGRLYEYFKENHTTQEQVAFLKNEYGIGTLSCGISFLGSNENHSTKVSVSKEQVVRKSSLHGATSQSAYPIYSSRTLLTRRRNRIVTMKSSVKKAVQVQETACIILFDYASVKDAHAPEISCSTRWATSLNFRSRRGGGCRSAGSQSVNP